MASFEIKVTPIILWTALGENSYVSKRARQFMVKEGKRKCQVLTFHHSFQGLKQPGLWTEFQDLSPVERQLMI